VPVEGGKSPAMIDDMVDLPAPILPQKRNQLALVHVQVDAGQDYVAVKALLDPAQGQPRHGAPLRGIARTVRS